MYARRQGHSIPFYEYTRQEGRFYRNLAPAGSKQKRSSVCTYGNLQRRGTLLCPACGIFSIVHVCLCVCVLYCVS